MFKNITLVAVFSIAFAACSSNDDASIDWNSLLGGLFQLDGDAGR